MGCSPGATAPRPQSGAVVERIAVAYELRFAHYVRVATAIAGCLAYREDGPLAAHRTLCGRLEPVAA